jgi:hypothetical protein
MWEKYHKEDFIIENKKLSEKEQYILLKWFNKVKRFLLKELLAKVDKEKNTNKILLLKKYIKRVKLLDSSIIKFSDKKSKVNWETVFNKWKSKEIILYSNNLAYQTDNWIDILLYHEFQHFIWRDKQWKEINKDTRELNTKILSFRYFMNKNKYKISLDWISKLYHTIKNEIEGKWNHLSESEEIELRYIYEKFKTYENKKKLEIHLQNLVKLEELKKEVHYT